MKILVVDDEKLLVKGVKFNLENEGYEVTAAYDGAAAVELAKKENFDLIVMDVKLLVLGYPRNMDGSEGPRAEKCAAFGELLRQETGLEVILWDERRTTIGAHNTLFQNGKNAKKRKKTGDAVAGALMLEGYLTRRRLEAQK